MPYDVAITDAILAALAGREGFRLLSRPQGGTIAGVGLLIVALAAAFGALRYAGVAGLEGAHDGVIRLAGQVGLPLVGVGYVVAAFVPQHGPRVRPYAFVVLLLLAVALIDVPSWTTIIGGLGMVAVAVGAGRLGQRYPAALLFGLVGALGILVNGLYVRGAGSVGFLSRGAWFHLGLAGSAWALAQGLLRLPENLVEDDHGQD